MESELRTIKSRLDRYPQQIAPHKQSIENFKRREQLGLPFNESDYSKEIEEHNRLARLHNRDL